MSSVMSVWCPCILKRERLDIDSRCHSYSQVRHKHQTRNLKEHTVLYLTIQTKNITHFNPLLLPQHNTPFWISQYNMPKKPRSARRRKNFPIGDEDVEHSGDVDVVSDVMFKEMEMDYCERKMIHANACVCWLCFWWCKWRSLSTFLYCIHTYMH